MQVVEYAPIGVPDSVTVIPYVAAESAMCTAMQLATPW